MVYYCKEIGKWDIATKWSVPLRVNGVDGGKGDKGEPGDKGESPATVLEEFIAIQIHITALNTDLM